MTPLEIAEAMYVPVVATDFGGPGKLGIPKGWFIVEDPPTNDALLCTNKKEFCVFFSKMASLESLTDPLIHDVCHAVVGKEGFRDEAESGLMALQWALIQELDPPFYAEARNVFAEYGLPGQYNDLVGLGKRFLRTKAWKQIVQSAVENGFLMPDGRPVWGLGTQIKRVQSPTSKGSWVFLKDVEVVE